jgi:hypothetical protein
MLSVIVCILLYQVFTGVVEGLKNRPTSMALSWWTSDAYYHVWRLTQGVFIVLAVMFWPGCTFLHVAALLLTWTGGDALYNRIICLVSQGNINDANGDVFRIARWEFPYPPVWTDWARFAGCAAAAILL